MKKLGWGGLNGLVLLGGLALALPSQAQTVRCQTELNPGHQFTQPITVEVAPGAANAFLARVQFDGQTYVEPAQAMSTQSPPDARDSMVKMDLAEVLPESFRGQLGSYRGYALLRKTSLSSYDGFLIAAYGKKGEFLGNYLFYQFYGPYRCGN